MKPEIKKLWINALLSGEYRQTQEVLCKRDDTMCCLGVLCDLYLKKNNRSWVDEGEEYVYFPATTGRFEHEVLPAEVMEWAGLETEMGKFSYSYSPVVDPFIEQGNTVVSLAELNDKGMTFKDIALVIDEYFLEY